jgi:hypothetical protein
MSTPPFPGMDELLQRLLDDQIQPDEMKHLQEAMLKDPRVQDYYIDSMFACAVMRRCSHTTGELSTPDLIRMFSGGSRGGSGRVVRHLYSIAAVLILGISIFASLCLFRHRDQGPAIGMLADAYEAQWRGSHPRPGEPLYVGPYDLRNGVARMELGQGTSLLLEAPCQIELKNAGEVTLRAGSLVAAVSSQAKGFQVRTLTALITDLGTEFGVIAHADGSMEAHVLKGHVSIALDPNRSRRPTSLIVNEHQAAAVDARGLAIQGGLAARTELFLLQMPSGGQPTGLAGRLNLADIVGGGNGRGTGTLDRGIDLGTGQVFKGPATAIRRTQQNEFRPSPQFRGIDGVFMPNGANGPVVISSTGLLFSECPQTRGSYYGGPANSGKFFDIPSQQIHTALLRGINYGTSNHPALSLHPNAGITFDLDQIRQDNSDIRIDRFTAVCGIPRDLPQPPFSSADVWVLLDGVVGLHLHYSAERSVVEKVEVPIPAQTRFLTLVAACSGRADYSWILFGDPFLEPADPK